jgi:hypothetical protein
MVLLPYIVSCKIRFADSLRDYHRKAVVAIIKILPKSRINLDIQSKF